MSLSARNTYKVFVAKLDHGRRTYRKYAQAAKQMKISIAMATFNGGHFLQQQLASLVTQTRLPDELVVCDDGSTDATLQIAEAFSGMAPFEVHIHRNPQRLGCAGNFSRALSLCTGSIVFLSDQDDVWFPTKIERVANVFEASDGILLVINDAAITDKGLQPSGFTQIGQIRKLGLPLEYFVNGSCSAISTRLISLVTPIPGDEVAHDNWIHKLAGEMGVRKVLDEVLQYYRRHEENASKSLISTNSELSRWDWAREYAQGDAYAAAMKRLSTLDRMSKRLHQAQQTCGDREIIFIVSKAMRKLKREYKMVSLRIRLLDEPLLLRIPLAFFFWLRGGYRLFSGWKSLSKDLLTFK